MKTAKTVVTAGIHGMATISANCGEDKNEEGMNGIFPRAIDSEKLIQIQL
jgi:hypothetical protein